MNTKNVSTCPTHGDYESKYFEIAGQTRKYPCPKCAPLNMASWTSMTKEQLLEQQHQERVKNAVEAFNRSVPIRFRSATFDSYTTIDPIQNPEDRMVKAKSLCERYASNFETLKDKGAGLIFCGTVGSGKTHLAVSLGKEVAKRGYFAEYSNLMGIIREVRDTWGDDTKHENTVLKRLQTKDLLIIDEIGVQSGSDSERNIIFEIINGRYENIKPTIIISNLTINEIERVISERSVDRITDGGGGVITFNWESYRNGKGRAA
jgi:DNA replication protein DnaC